MCFSVQGYVIVVVLLAGLSTKHHPPAFPKHKHFHTQKFLSFFLCSSTLLPSYRPSSIVLSSHDIGLSTNVFVLVASAFCAVYLCDPSSFPPSLPPPFPRVGPSLSLARRRDEGREGRGVLCMYVYSIVAPFPSLSSWFQFLLSFFPHSPTLFVFVLVPVLSASL